MTDTLLHFFILSPLEPHNIPIRMHRNTFTLAAPSKRKVSAQYNWTWEAEGCKSNYVVFEVIWYFC